MAFSLKNLIVPTKEIETEYPGMPGFKLKLCFLSRETLQKMRKSATRNVYKKHQPSEEFDDELFLELYVKATIKGWTGLKLSYLKELVPIELGDADPNLELDYSEEEALELTKGSMIFDQFVSEFTSDLGNFTKSN